MSSVAAIPAPERAPGAPARVLGRLRSINWGRKTVIGIPFVFLVLFAVMVIYNDLVKTLPGLTRMP